MKKFITLAVSFIVAALMLFTVAACNHDVKVSGVTLSATTLSLEVGDTANLTATVAPADAKDKSVTWATSASSVATVADGKVTAVAAGTANITVTTTDGNFTATCAVTVTNPAPSVVAVTGVTLSAETLSLEVGGTSTLTATVEPANATNKAVTWATSDQAVATVADGVVTAVAAGTADITVTTTDGSHTATCAVTVTNPAPAVVPVTNVTLTPATLSLEVGGHSTLTATVEPANATNKAVTWATSDQAVATVADGVVTAVSAGTANITVTTADGSHTATCVVTVTNPAPAVVPVTNVTLTPATLSLEVGGHSTLTATVEPANATNKAVSWATSDQTVATVADGVVTAVAAGTANITVTTADGNHTATCVVTVTRPQSQFTEADWQAAFAASLASTQHRLDAKTGSELAQSAYIDRVNKVIYNFTKDKTPEMYEVAPDMTQAEKSITAYVNAGTRWAKVSQPFEGDSLDEFYRNNDIMGRVFNDWFATPLAECFADFTYNSETGEFTATGLRMGCYPFDHSSSDYDVNVAVVISDGKVVSVKITNITDKEDIEVTIQYVPTTVPQEVIDSADAPIAEGAMTQTEWEEIFDGITSLTANYTVELDMGMDMPAQAAAEPAETTHMTMLKQRTQVAMDKGKLFSTEQVTPPQDYTASGTYIVTKEGVSASFEYDTDSGWGKGKYMSPTALKEYLASFQYDKTLLGSMGEYFREMYGMCTFEKTTAGNKYSIIQDFGGGSPMEIVFLFDDDNVLLSISTQIDPGSMMAVSDPSGPSGGDQMVDVVYTFSKFGETDVTYPTEEPVMPEQPDLTSEQWEQIFDDLTDAENAVYTVTIEIRQTESDPAPDPVSITIKVNCVNGIIEISIPEEAADHEGARVIYLILNEDRTGGGKFVYAEDTWKGTEFLQLENFESCITSMCYDSVVSGEWLSALSNVSNLQSQYDSTEYANGKYTYGDMVAEFAEGKLSKVTVTEVNKVSTVTFEYSAEITVPAERPAMPEIPDMTEQEWNEAFENIMNSSAYQITVENYDGNEDASAGKTATITFDGDTLKIADIYVDEDAVKVRTDIYYIGEDGYYAKFVYKNDAWEEYPSLVTSDNFSNIVISFNFSELADVSVFSYNAIPYDDLQYRFNSAVFTSGKYTIIENNEIEYVVQFENGIPVIEMSKTVEDKKVTSTVRIVTENIDPVVVPENRPEFPTPISETEYGEAITNFKEANVYSLSDGYSEKIGYYDGEDHIALIVDRDRQSGNLQSATLLYVEENTVKEYTTTSEDYNGNPTEWQAGETHEAKSSPEEAYAELQYLFNQKVTELLGLDREGLFAEQFTPYVDGDPQAPANLEQLYPYIIWNEPQRGIVSLEQKGLSLDILSDSGSDGAALAVNTGFGTEFDYKIETGNNVKNYIQTVKGGAGE